MKIHAIIACRIMSLTFVHFHTTTLGHIEVAQLAEVCFNSHEEPVTSAIECAMKFSI